MRVVPGAIAIIATASGLDRTGMAATAWNSLCADPPMLLVCVNQSASAHELIHRAGKFSVNIVAAEEQEIVAIFSAQRGLHGADRFLDGHWDFGPEGQPLLKSAVAAFECTVAADHVYGTHSIFIGAVGAMRNAGNGEALLYRDGAFGVTADLAPRVE
jgi:flavin reductase